MQEHIEEKVDLSGDFFPFFQEEDMPESIPHAALIRYLVDVLKWLFHSQVCLIEGMARQRRFVKGAFRDVKFYAILREDFFGDKRDSSL